ncbi:WD40 repeat-like protein [Basidiobolus meristosporus CBS 931.73]|uniref:WD40 repeat-like protein n=1 Tax=Basidiobolus meristosporus CBS 931.73 TaxID=1314790 RepID=A0A1Y1YMK3_9FUNG|nr:WD40 repeat-like protein [Basidiobolus meristosporus CBS 931.73]|eukprot:ORX99250.1 WD40 repeat-like protein [Basidiobolus meristosporus CBS 931.73]
MSCSKTHQDGQPDPMVVLTILGIVEARIHPKPYRVLDTPDLKNDFYLSLIDWSSQNVLCIGLGASLFLWNGYNGKTTKLCELSQDSISSVAWDQKGTHLALGTDNGLVQIWDVERRNIVRCMTGHRARTGAMSWCNHSLATGSKDRSILLRDPRSQKSYYSILSGHTQEVCGLKWNADEELLASGGNDNSVRIWDASENYALHVFEQHVGAVKALDWSPHKSNLLVSGGGTYDKKLRFWDVCQLRWSKISDEIISTHGYSEYEVVVWDYQSRSRLATLAGHTSRVLYLAMSPDGRSFVTGAGEGDETLRFWHLVAPAKKTNSSLSQLSLIR